MRGDEAAPAVTAEVILALREHLRLSRAVFGRTLHTKVRTRENWEPGRAQSNAQATLRWPNPSMPNGTYPWLLGLLCANIDQDRPVLRTGATMDISAYEAKTTLPALLKRVIAGETITITKYGTPVARITPMTATVGHDQDAAIEALKNFAQGCTTGGVGIRAMIEEGRR